MLLMQSKRQLTQHHCCSLADWLRPIWQLLKMPLKQYVTHQDYDVNAAWLRFWLQLPAVQLYLNLSLQRRQPPQLELQLTVEPCLQRLMRLLKLRQLL